MVQGMVWYMVPCNDSMWYGAGYGVVHGTMHRLSMWYGAGYGMVHGTMH